MDMQPRKPLYPLCNARQPLSCGWRTPLAGVLRRVIALDIGAINKSRQAPAQLVGSPANAITLLTFNDAGVARLNALQLRNNIFNVCARLGLNSFNDALNSIIESGRRIRRKRLGVFQFHDDVPLFANLPS